MRIAKIRKMDISNGPYSRVSLFTQGCKHKCHGCFNPETWDFEGGREWNQEVNDIIIKLMDNDQVKGLSILGGDPFCWYDWPYGLNEVKQDYLYDLLKTVKMKYPEKTIWLWTGYLWEDFFVDPSVTIYGPFIHGVQQALKYIDVLVDGPFIMDEKDPRLKYAGSRNQRVIDVKKSSATNVVLYGEEK